MFQQIVDGFDHRLSQETVQAHMAKTVHQQVLRSAARFGRELYRIVGPAFGRVVGRLFRRILFRP